MAIHLIDLHFQGHPGTIAVFLVETTAGPVLIESGPSTTLPALESGVAAVGYRLADIAHVFLTHIHFDHAGAAWRLAEHGATIHVHPQGIDHLADPAVLWKSAKRIFGDAMEPLWGEMRPIAPAQLRAWEDGEGLEIGDQVFRAWHTPGHAKHHIVWQVQCAVFAGDVGGVCLRGGPVQPPCPPPDIDLEAWRQSIARLRQLEAETLYLTHFGVVRAIAPHLDALESELDEWCRWMEERLDRESLAAMTAHFADYVNARLQAQGLSEAARAEYELVNPAFMSVQGLARYLQKKKH